MNGFRQFQVYAAALLVLFAGETASGEEEPDSAHAESRTEEPDLTEGSTRQPDLLRQADAQRELLHLLLPAIDAAPSTGKGETGVPAMLDVQSVPPNDPSWSVDPTMILLASRVRQLLEGANLPPDPEILNECREIARHQISYYTDTRIGDAASTDTVELDVRESLLKGRGVLDLHASLSQMEKPIDLGQEELLLIGHTASRTGYVDLAIVYLLDSCAHPEQDASLRALAYRELHFCVLRVEGWQVEGPEPDLSIIVLQCERHIERGEYQQAIKVVDTLTAEPLKSRETLLIIELLRARSYYGLKQFEAVIDCADRLEEQIGPLTDSPLEELRNRARNQIEDGRTRALAMAKSQAGDSKSAGLLLRDAWLDEPSNLRDGVLAIKMLVEADLLREASSLAQKLVKYAEGQSTVKATTYLPYLKGVADQVSALAETGQALNTAKTSKPQPSQGTSASKSATSPSKPESKPKQTRPKSLADEFLQLTQ